MFQDIEGKITYEYRPAEATDFLVLINEGKPALTEEGFLPTLAESGFTPAPAEGGSAASEAAGGLPGAGQPVTLSSAADVLSEEDSYFLQYLLTYGDKAFYALLPTGSSPTALFLAGPVKLEYRAMRTLFVSEDQGLHFAAATACHLAVWYRNNQYCGRCGQMLLPADNDRALVCPSCGLEIFPSIAPVVIVGVLYNGKILLTRYADPRGYRRHALVAGFCEIGEAFEDTVRREVYEEAGLHVRNITYYKSQPWAFSQSLLAGFFCEAEDDRITINTDGRGELSEAAFYAPEEITAEDNALALTWTMIRDFCRDPEAVAALVRGK
ncbi:MAG: NUDIX domain-containing protein [Lachnospiraceae bacterium]|nr:NUDIX domain-containing protein [Lachnospiraceae bacterium]